jgi:hypothetical protein
VSERFGKTEEVRVVAETTKKAVEAAQTVVVKPFTFWRLLRDFFSTFFYLHLFFSFNS